jgi:hypothetical protein
MRKVRVYADTSVFGGVEDVEFAEHSRRFFDQVRQGRYVLLMSSEVLRELEEAPDGIRGLWRDLPPGAVEAVPAGDEATSLARAYVEAGIVGTSSEADALHVAIAVVADADVIASWNFKHIVNRRRIQLYNAVNVIRGYGTVDIFSPRELVEDDEEDL